MNSDDELPSYLPRRKGRSTVLNNATPEDFVWVGEDCTIDPVALTKHLFGPTAVLRELLLAIIKAHPIRDCSEDKRLDEALRALVGGGERRRGPKVRSSSDPVLMEIARQRFLQKFGFGDPNETMRSHVRKALLSQSDRSFPDPEDPNGNPEELDNAVRAMVKRYEKDADTLLSAVSLLQEQDAHRFRLDVAKGITALRELGIIPDEPEDRP
jgi:hypothetical protein